MDYAAIADAASEILEEYGQAATLRRTVPGTYDDTLGAILYSLSTLTVTVDATAKTYTRAAGSWLTDGVVVGDEIVFSGFVAAGNNATLTVTTASALVLTFSAATGLVNVSADEGVAAYCLGSERITDYSTYALEDYNRGISVWGSELGKDSLVSEADRFFFLLAAYAPLANDKLIIGSTTLVIQGVKPLSPGATAIMYCVRARG